MNLQEFKMNVEIAFKPHKVAYVAIWDKIFRVYVHICMEYLGHLVGFCFGNC